MRPGNHKAFGCPGYYPLSHIWVENLYIAMLMEISLFYRMWYLARLSELLPPKQAEW